MITSLAEFSATVATLGRRIEMKFASVGADPQRLPEIAAVELEGADLEIEFTAAEIPGFLASTECAQQPDLTFSDLPLTFYRSPNLYIEALIWTSSTTTIHQHGFSGAFKVVCGSSVHTRYAFKKRRELTPSLAFGALSSFGSEILERGAVRHIWPGDKLVHSLFHLENPSITLVARSYRLPEYDPQYSYFEPGIQIDEPGLEKHQVVKMAGRLLSTARSVGGGELLSAWRAMCKTLPFDQLVFLFLKAGSSGFFGPELPRATELFSVACNDEREIVIEALDYLMMKHRIAAARQVIDDKDLRFLLALLMTAPNHAAIRQAVVCRHPGQNADRLLARWLTEFSVGKQVLGRALESLVTRMQSRGGAALQLSHDLRTALGSSTDFGRVEEMFAQMLGVPEITAIDGHAAAAIKARLAAIRDVAILFSSESESATMKL